MFRKLAYEGFTGLFVVLKRGGNNARVQNNDACV